jgi:tetratricopeptide (TPR) repeat protein
MSEAEKAIVLNPSGFLSNHMKGYVLLFVGRPKEAIRYYKRALELDPLFPGWTQFFMGFAHFNMGQFDESVDLIKRALTHYPKNAGMKAILAAAYAHLGRDQEARNALKDYLKLYSPRTPDLDAAMSGWPFKEQKDTDRLAQGLVKAGFPGPAFDYCKISKQNKLTGKEIRKLQFGHTMKGTFLGMQWSLSRDGEGKCTMTNPLGSYSGRSWIEGDKLFTQYETYYEGRKHDSEIYRNPGGTQESTNEYCSVSDYGIFPFSVVD